MQEIDIIFNDNKEILKIIENNGSIIDSIGLPNEKCVLIGSKIKLVDLIGEGSYGQVFSITIPGKGERKYVVKKGELKTERIMVTKEKLSECLKSSGLVFEDISSF